MSIGSQVGSAEETIDLVAVVAILAVVGYALYKFPDIIDSIKNDLNTAFGGMFSNPGGGETAGTSETYSGALSTTASDPTGTIGTILGSPPVYDTIPDPTTTPGLPAGYDPSTGTIDENLTYNGATQ